MEVPLDILRIKKLIWAYFFLLIFEGALRKWVLPSLSTPLLVIRDPVVIAIYWLALRTRIFPRNKFMFFGIPLALACLAVGVFAPAGSLSVALFGFRSNFLHLPLIFIFPSVFTIEDVRKVGYWTLLLSLPLALLMIVQFRSSPDAWINSGADQQFKQIDAALGRIRAPATFTFISGPVYFYSLVAAFLFWGQFSNRVYPAWLINLALVALISAAVVSGSRSLIAGVAIVFLFATLCASLLQPGLIFRWVWIICLVSLLIYIMNDLTFFQEGVEVLNARVEGSSRAEGGFGGFLNRFFSEYTNALPLFIEAPLLGYGLGIGTNAGSAMLTGDVRFLLAEGEWGRVLLESGPILGGAFLILRICLAFWLGGRSWSLAARGNPLPILIFGVCFLLLVGGQFGQTTGLGFAVLATGLCLSAGNVKNRPRRSTGEPRTQQELEPDSGNKPLNALEQATTT